MFGKFSTLSACAAAALLCVPAICDAQVRVNVGRGGYAGRPYYGGGYYGGGYNRGAYYGARGPYYGPGVVVGNRYGYNAPLRGYYNSGFYAAPGVVVAQPAPPLVTQSFYPPANAQPAPAATSDGSASIVVTLPANAELWWNGVFSTTTGDTRRFRTSVLAPEGNMQRFQARWRDANGQEVVQSREIRVMPSGNFTVDFNRPAN
jgi:hypothetical protein